MSGNVYKKIELVGSSSSSIEDAIRGAVARAAKTVRHLEWFEVKGTRGWIENGEIQHFQVILEIGFRLDE